MSSEGLKILIVDDNFAAAQTTGWLVEALGHDFSLAGNADGAMEKVSQSVPDVVLLDLGLPGMNGLDLCREMKTMPALANTVFVAQTGYGDAGHRRRAAEVGCEHFLLKPFDIGDLEAILNGISRDRQGG